VLHPGAPHLMHNLGSPRSFIPLHLSQKFPTKSDPRGAIQPIKISILKKCSEGGICSGFTNSRSEMLRKVCPSTSGHMNKHIVKHIEDLFILSDLGGTFFPMFTSDLRGEEGLNFFSNDNHYHHLIPQLPQFNGTNLCSHRRLLCNTNPTTINPKQL
jgi:hypothetical protein